MDRYTFGLVRISGVLYSKILNVSEHMQTVCTRPFLLYKEPRDELLPYQSESLKIVTTCISIIKLLPIDLYFTEELATDACFRPVDHYLSIKTGGLEQPGNTEHEELQS